MKRTTREKIRVESRKNIDKNDGYEFNGAYLERVRPITKFNSSTKEIRLSDMEVL